MTAPLVPPDVDLRGTGWMPYWGHLLRGSELNASVSDAGFRAAHNLWWAAWNEVPAASLPDNDRLLCRFADLGSNLDAFLAIRDEALHGFVKCDDGRLYHKFLAGEAIRAWEIQGLEDARRSGARNRMRRLREQRDDVRGTDGHIVREQTPDVRRNRASPPLDSPPNTNIPTNPRARRRATPQTPQGAFLAKNGNGAAPPPPINPRNLGHSLPCACPNCTRWVQQQHTEVTA